MRLIELKYPHYKLQHRSGYEFIIEAIRTEQGGLRFSPLQGWRQLEVETQQDLESLLEDIDDTIFNATPEKYEE